MAIGDGNPEILYTKTEEEHKMNKYLATENLPKQLHEAKTRIKELTNIMNEPALSDADLNEMEIQIKSMNGEIAKLSEKRLSITKSQSSGDKLTLFRQQGLILARKKEGTAQKLANVTEGLRKLEMENTKKNEKLRTLQGAKVYYRSTFFVIFFCPVFERG